MFFRVMVCVSVLDFCAAMLARMLSNLKVVQVQNLIQTPPQSSSRRRIITYSTHTQGGSNF
jgi:hypothetical protein